MQIEREPFEAWLFSQPDDRTFRYTNITDCLVCKFLHETTSLRVVCAAPDKVILADHSIIPLPIWLDGDPEFGKPNSLLATGRFEKLETGGYSFGDVKKRYREMFPDYQEAAEQPAIHTADKPIVFHGIQPKG